MKSISLPFLLLLYRKEEGNLINQFYRFLEEDGKSPSTIASYVGDVRGFLEWLNEKRVEFRGQLQRFFVTSFKKYLLDMDYEINTINKKINSLVSFNQFLIKQGMMNEIVVDLKKDKVKVANGSEKEVEVYSDLEVERILFYVQDVSRVSIRDRLIINLLLYTGIRVSELVSIKLKDIDFLTMQLKVLGKGGKAREIPLRLEVVEMVKEYLDTERRQHKLKDSEYLLLSQRAEKMDRDVINKLLKKHGKVLGITMKPHKFRHTFCTRLLNLGVPITTVSKLAGHSGIQTTAAFYINTSRQDKQEAVELL